MVYSRKPQEELEKESGEKLYKVSEGVYVNQVTHDEIQSEHKPVIETLSTAEFSSHHYEKSDLICATWHPVELKLLCITGSPADSVRCLVFNIDEKQLLVESETEIALPHPSEQILDVAHHPSLPRLLITCNNQLVIWDYAKHEIVANIDLAEYKVSQGGFYLNKQLAWTLSATSHNSGHDWLIWDYAADQTSRYELERHDHYGRGAVLHPGGLLIGAVWNAYDCGYHLHASEPVSGDLYYYSKPSPERSEYESYLPCFSPDGKRFAFFANPYLAMHQNYSKLCVYNIETAAVDIEFHTGTKLMEKQLQFADGGKTLTFWEAKTNNFYIFDAKSGKNIQKITASSNIKYLTGHRLSSHYAAVHETGLSVFFSASKEDTSLLNQKFMDSSIDVAKRFIEANSEHLIKVNG